MEWRDILEEVATFRQEVFESKRAEPFYRGQSNNNWLLQPSLFRTSWDCSDQKKILIHESRLYWAFIQMSAHLLPPSLGGWETLFMLQHYGVPTRLLDWTRSFSTALWFALADEQEAEPCVWLLNPYLLNQIEADNCCVFLPVHDFTPDNGHPVGYEPYITDYEKKTFLDFPYRIAAIAGGSSISRVRSQAGVFTIHRDPTMNIIEDSQANCCLKKIVIPKQLIQDARLFLKLAGINSSTIFPDLQGISMYLKRAILSNNWDSII
jgi:hypothetical protein